jgi:hypothetical protein
VVFGLLQQLEALGLNVPTVLQQLGVKPSAQPDPAKTPVPGSTPQIPPGRE